MRRLAVAVATLTLVPVSSHAAYMHISDNGTTISWEANGGDAGVAISVDGSSPTTGYFSGSVGSSNTLTWTTNNWTAWNWDFHYYITNGTGGPVTADFHITGDVGTGLATYDYTDFVMQGAPPLPYSYTSGVHTGSTDVYTTSQHYFEFSGVVGFLGDLSAPSYGTVPAYPSAVAEPISLTVLGVGFGALAFARRRRTA